MCAARLSKNFEIVTGQWLACARADMRQSRGPNQSDGSRVRKSGGAPPAAGRFSSRGGDSVYVGVCRVGSGTSPCQAAGRGLCSVVIRGVGSKQPWTVRGMMLAARAQGTITVVSTLCGQSLTRPMVSPVSQIRRVPPLSWPALSAMHTPGDPTCRRHQPRSRAQRYTPAACRSLCLWLCWWPGVVGLAGT